MRGMSLAALAAATIMFLLLSVSRAGQLTASREAPQEKKVEEAPATQSAPPENQRVARSITILSEEVRHQLLLLPYYDVFDWLEGSVTPDGKVTLHGEVVRPIIRDNAEDVVKRIEGVSSVTNQIEILPPSPNDDKLRVALYRVVYNFNSPLFRYALLAVPPIHIVVKNGRVTLKGAVLSPSDSDLAYNAAHGVSGVLGVTNQLKVEETKKQ